MRAKPTERQAARAARQLCYHRKHLDWITEKIRSNRDLLALYVGESQGETILSGGFRVRLHRTEGSEEISVEEPRPVATHHQLTLCIEERKTA